MSAGSAVSLIWGLLFLFIFGLCYSTSSSSFFSTFSTSGHYSITHPSGDSTPTNEQHLPPVKKNFNFGLIVGIVIGAGVLILVMVIFYIVQRRKRPNNDYDEELLGIDVGPLTFSFSEQKAATNDFSPDNKLEEGGFGPVYKGTLNDGRVIALKQLSAASHQRKNQFVTEIATISAVQHHNLVTLYGFCIEGVKRLLVYEYLENKSLDQTLFGMRITLSNC